MTFWYEAPLAAFATRPRTGAAGEDRIGCAALVTQLARGTAFGVRQWPVGAAVRPAMVVEEVARALAGQWRLGTPLVVLDAPYELTLLDRELFRLRGTRLADHLARASLCVLDPLVLHGHLAPAEAATLGPAELLARYGGLAPGTAPRAHGPVPEAAAALTAVRALGTRFAPRLACLSPAELHALQAVWFTTQVRGAASWFTGGAGAGRSGWPLRTERGRSA